MIHPSTELRFINDKIGYGIFATQRIPKGTITWALDKLDQIFTPAEFNCFEPWYQKVLDIYCYRDHQGRYILSWDHARFINHSSNSNTLSTAYDFEIAVRDIESGEQITDDYGAHNLKRPFLCEREEGLDRQWILPDDLVRFHKVWDKHLLDAFSCFHEVDQPLSFLLNDQLMRKVKAISKGQDKMDSILDCYFAPSA